MNQEDKRLVEDIASRDNMGVLIEVETGDMYVVDTKHYCILCIDVDHINKAVVDTLLSRNCKLIRDDDPLYLNYGTDD